MSLDQPSVASLYVYPGKITRDNNCVGVLVAFMTESKFERVLQSRDARVRQSNASASPRQVDGLSEYLVLFPAMLLTSAKFMREEFFTGL